MSTDLSSPMRKKSRSSTRIKSTQADEHLKVFWIQPHLWFCSGLTHIWEMLMEEQRDEAHVSKLLLRVLVSIEFGKRVA